ncbi:hypothetical protein L3X38_002232 [Prunus dulcis]|uniref:Uncharacterized protein n=1 Tax=Prunus dulcis TaxID=3755 RepID=A0AAD4ZKK5_PRUDU|nr:hypothetical protein L3X38_002232 [Prunus dulcis]
MSALFAVKFHLPITVEHYLNALFMVFGDYPPMSNLDTAGAVMVFAMKTAGIPVNSIIPHGSSGTIDNHSPHIVEIFNNNDPDQFQSSAGPDILCFVETRSVSSTLERKLIQLGYNPVVQALSEMSETSFYLGFRCGFKL